MEAVTTAAGRRCVPESRRFKHVGTNTAVNALLLELIQRMGLSYADAAKATREAAEFMEEVAREGSANLREARLR